MERDHQTKRHQLIGNAMKNVGDLLWRSRCYVTRNVSWVNNVLRQLGCYGYGVRLLGLSGNLVIDKASRYI